MTNYFMFAGEASGDLHGSRLLKALSKKDSTGRFFGVGGPRMRQEPFECLLAMEKFQVMGLSDVLKSLPQLWKNFHRIKKLILDKKPDCAILIDYPGFNLRLAKALRQSGFSGKLVQYICPTVWAHGKKRIEALNTFYDLLLTIYPFEASYFDHSKLRVEYVGNPLAETISNYPYQTDWASQFGLPQKKELIALFPGSRLGEIQRHAPKQIQAAAALKKRCPKAFFAISCASKELESPLLAAIQKGPLKLNQDLILIPPQHHYDLMRASGSALAKSGTVTLELALHAVPTVVHYDLSLLNHLFAKYFLKLQLPNYCIVNILSNQRVFPEFMGRKIALQDLATALESVHMNLEHRQGIGQQCEQLKGQLGLKASHEMAAKAILETLKC